MKRGFTLIELLIVVAIIGIMVVVAVPQFSKFGKRSDLSSRAEEIKLLIENSYQQSKSPALGYNGSLVTINFGSEISSVSHITKFSNLTSPWEKVELSTTSSQVTIPGDMTLENMVNDDTKLELYFVSPGIYLKKDSDLQVWFKLSSTDNDDYVNIRVFPTKTKDSSNQNFRVTINPSWQE